MSLLFFLLLFVFILGDVHFMRLRNPIFFKEVFNFSKKYILIVVSICALIACVPEKQEQLFLLFAIIFLIPTYLMRRQRYIQQAERFEYLTSLDVSKAVLVSDAFGVVIYWFLSGLMISILIRLAHIAVTFEGVELLEVLLTVLGSTIVLLFFIVKTSKKFSPGNFWVNVGFRKGPYSTAQIVAVSVLLGIFFAFISGYLTTVRGVNPSTPLSEAIEATQSASIMLVFIILALFTAPLWEEIIFRGYFFHIFEIWLGRFWAIFIVSGLFALLHVEQYWGDWMAIGVVALLGFALTALRAFTKTTLSSTIMHYVYNIGVTLVPMIILSAVNPPYFKYQTDFPKLSNQEKTVLLKESITIQPDLADAYNDLAWVYATEKIHLDEALRLIEKAIYLDKESDKYLDTKAEVLESMAKKEKAVHVREEILEMDVPEQMKEYQQERIDKLKKE